MEVLHQSSNGMVDFGCGAMELQPPWAGELRARNRKVARSVWSTSDLSEIERLHHQHGGWTRSLSEEKERKVVDPVKISTTCNADQTPSSAVAATMRTEKAASMRIRRDRDVSIEESSDAEIKSEMKENMANGQSENGEESILEYGPGIVRKLRSKYQSLALRQIALRPSLRRAASLENGLDLETDTAVITTPTPTPEAKASPRLPENLPPVPSEPTRTRAFRSNMTLNINDGTNFSRGRSEVNRRARMTRARSVDALHRVDRTPEEEEILEKFKTVVEPKEEVVIIEVLKPRRNLGIGNVNINNASSPSTTKPNLTLHDKVESYNASANVNVNANGKAAGVGVHGTCSSDSQVDRGRSSPEYELPPADIVRETARIFETNPAGSLLARHTKSASVSPINPSSPTPVPVPPITSSTILIVTNSEKVQNGNVTSSPSIRDNDNKSQLNNIGRQVGVIRPTVNGVSKGLELVKIGKASPGIGPATVNVDITEKNYKVATTRIRLLNNNKPPLGPKPMFTSQSTKLQLNGSSKGVESSGGINELKEVTNRINRSPSPIPVHKPRQNQISNNNNCSNNVPLLNGNGPTAMKESESLSNTKVSHFPVTLKPVNAKFTVAENQPVQRQRNAVNGNVILSVNNSESTTVKPTIVQQSRVSNNVKDLGSVSVTPAKTTIMSAKNLKPSGKDAENNNEVTKTKDGKETVSVDAGEVESRFRTHQKQKSSEQLNGGGGSIVFNFTTRNNPVPDYIEDDGLHRNRVGGDESVDDVDSIEMDKIDPKLFQFTGANVIINGKSSFQKNPKSQKMCISFSEKGPTTFEYPSESSMLTEEDTENNKDNLLGQKTPNLINGSGGGGGLGSYTPSKVTSLYQLGSYKERLIDSNNKKSASEERSNKEEGRTSNGDLIEDYLKPDTEGTTWSNAGAADILF